MRDKNKKTKKTHLELHGARDAELFDGDGKVEAEVLEVVGVEGANFVKRPRELSVDVVQVAILYRPRKQHFVTAHPGE